MNIYESQMFDAMPQQPKQPKKHNLTARVAELSQDQTLLKARETFSLLHKLDRAHRINKNTVNEIHRFISDQIAKHHQQPWINSQKNGIPAIQQSELLDAQATIRNCIDFMVGFLS